jgi:hypothetical protein
MPFVWVGLHRGTQGFRRPSFRILPEFRDSALDWMTFRSVELAQRRLFVRALMENQKKPRMLVTEGIGSSIPASTDESAYLS